MKTSTRTRNIPTPKVKRLWRFIALVMSMAMLFSMLLVAFHHHDDERDHDDDCPICAVAHHRTTDVGITLPDVNYQPFSYPTFFASLVLTLPVTRYCYSTQNRAPPV
jgi:hypothetical protein